MGIGVTGILQVKVPVSDLRRSYEWYVRLLDLELAREFVEQGVLRGVVLADRSAGYVIGLRDREVVRGRPTHDGFDLFALHVPTREALDAVVERCDRLGVEHTDVHERGPDGAAFDVPDPDGTVVRFLWPGDASAPGFAGVEFGEDGTPGFYDTPRIHG